jgi:putative membrane protein
MAHEAIASQLEDPFGTDENDLALNMMCVYIEDAMRDLIGESALTIPGPEDEQFLVN